MSKPWPFFLLLLALVLFVPSVWFYIHAGRDLFNRHNDFELLHNSRRFWLALAAPFVWGGHGFVIVMAILKSFTRRRRSDANGPES